MWPNRFRGGLRKWTVENPLAEQMAHQKLGPQLIGSTTAACGFSFWA